MIYGMVCTLGIVRVQNLPIESVFSIVEHLNGSELFNKIYVLVNRDPIERIAWPVDIVQNCSYCTFTLPESCLCVMCESTDHHQWNYVGDKDGDTTFQTPYTSAIVDRASVLIHESIIQLTDPSLGRKLMFCLTRPPGHHACTGKKLGFCHKKFAIEAADYAHSCGMRIVILDIDAHHGDSTEAELMTREWGYYVSLHAFGANIYPGTGEHSSERVLNIPLPASTDSQEWISAYRDTASPWIREKRPDLLILSSGFDGHKDDSLVPLALTEDSYRFVGDDLSTLGIPVLAILEGGYHIPVLGRCVEAIIKPFLK